MHRPSVTTSTDSVEALCLGQEIPEVASIRLVSIVSLLLAVSLEVVLQLPSWESFSLFDHGVSVSNFSCHQSTGTATTGFAIMS